MNFITTKTKESKCPQCGTNLGAASGENVVPCENDISICINCCALLQFNSDLTLRKIDEETYREIIEDDELREQVFKYQKVIKQI